MPGNLHIPINIHAITESQQAKVGQSRDELMRRLSDHRCVTLVVIIADDDETPARLILQRAGPDQYSTIEEIAKTVTALQALCGAGPGIIYSTSVQLPQPYQNAVDLTMSKIRSAIASANATYENDV